MEKQQSPAAVGNAGHEALSGEEQVLSGAAVVTAVEPDLESLKESIQVATTVALARGGLPLEKIETGEVRLPTVLYLVYWTHRLHNNPREQDKVKEHFQEYLSEGIDDPAGLVADLLANPDLRRSADLYTRQLLLPTKTVDLVITRSGTEEERDKEVLVVHRDYFPQGSSLPGGIIQETDEDNPLGLSAPLFAALRVAGEKVLGVGASARYAAEVDDKGHQRFLVRGEGEYPVVIIHPEDDGGYRIRESINSVLRPSDPRHIVDTTAFRCEIVGDPTGSYAWAKKSTIMAPNEVGGGLAFQHHREIISHITAQTSVEKERQLSERHFVRSIVANPLESYRALESHFKAHAMSPYAPMKELFPVVDRLFQAAFSEEINAICAEEPLLAGIRDKAAISLRHVSLKNRTFCPYVPTLHAIAETVAFFDIVARHQKQFYETMSKDGVVEHNPRTTPHASYHMYRYKYRMDELMSQVPNEIIIPTFESLSATDLMRVRGVPIRFVGLATDFLYVDEFEQSPEEFFMHDFNHSWRMSMEDKDCLEKYGRTREEMLVESNQFIDEYLDHIKIRSTDTEEERELKKLKKIILFEIVHEDARPFLRDVICDYIQQMEGGSVPFEVPRIDPETHYLDVVDTLDTGISTLSYVRNKLQHGFYDHVDAQLPQIVGLKYRTAAWITRAAHEMLGELGATPSPYADVDEQGQVSYEWLLRRTCSVGPDNIHDAALVDSSLAEFGDGAARLNPKRYQSGVTE